MSPLMSPKSNPKFKIALFLLVPSAPSSSVQGRDTCMDLENFYVTPCFSHDYHLTVVEYKKRKKINVLVKECFGAVLPEPVEGMRDRWAG